MPPYPPPRNAWQFPPPPITRGWKWAAYAVAVLSLIAGVGMIATAAIVGTKEAPGLIEDSQIVDVVSHECSIMKSTVESMPVRGGVEQQVSILRDQDLAVTHMLTKIRAIDAAVRAADRPTDDWLDDWDSLITARKEYAKLIMRGAEPDLQIPLDASGDQIQNRMNDVWLDRIECKVPMALLRPYPDDGSAV